MSLRSAVIKADAIFFDLFHTLYSFVGSGDSTKSTSELLGMPMDTWDNLLFNDSDDRLRGKDNCKYSIIRNLAHKHDPNIPEETIQVAADWRQKRFHNGLANLVTPKTDILKSLKDQGKKIGLVSNADSVEISGWFESPFEPLFDSVTFSYEVGHVKPEPEIYQHALDSLGVVPQNCIFVGDGSNDELQGAKELGFTTVMTVEMTQHRWPEKNRKRSAYADFIVDDLSALLQADGKLVSL